MSRHQQGGLRYRRSLLRLRGLLRDALLAAFLVFSKELLAALPNVELVSMLIISYTLVYRMRALVPIYLFVAIEWVLYPQPFYMVMYLYVWAILWGFTMLLPRRILPFPVYMLFGGLYGLAFGLLCAPAQAAFFGLNFSGMLAWIGAGFAFDLLHAVTNFAICCLVPPVVLLLQRLEARAFSQ